MLTMEVSKVDQPTVAIEADLTPYRHILESAVYHVIPLDHTAIGIAQAIVIQGTDNNALGVEDPETLTPVINADGMTPNEVLAAVEQRAAPRG